MRRTTCAGIIMLTMSLGLTAGLLPAPEVMAKPVRRPPIRVGLVNSMLRDVSEPMAKLVLKPLKGLLESQTGVKGEILLAGDAFALGQKLKDSRVKVGVFHGIEFAWARQKYPKLKPIVVAVNRYRYVQAKAVVSKSSPATSPTDLAGKVVAVPRQSRAHLYVFLDRRCTKPGTEPERFFSEVVQPISPEDALDAVGDGRAQLAVVDTVDLEKYHKAKSGRARELRVLAESERFPCTVVAYQPGNLSQSTVVRFRTGLLNARSNARGRQMLEMLQITHFETVPEDLDAQLASIVKLYLPPPPPK